MTGSLLPGTHPILLPCGARIAVMAAGEASTSSSAAKSSVAPRFLNPTSLTRVGAERPPGGTHIQHEGRDSPDGQQRAAIWRGGHRVLPLFAGRLPLHHGIRPADPGVACRRRFLPADQL